MGTFKCPFCKTLHVITHGDNGEHTCRNSIRQVKKNQNLRPNDMHTRKTWNQNEWSTRVDEFRDVEIVNIKPLPSDKNRFLGGTRSHNF